MLPPGCAKLATRPAPTGSVTCRKMIGTLRVAWRNGSTTGLPVATMTSGARATSSFAYRRLRSASPAPKRKSICTLLPLVQPNCCNACRNAALRACASASSAARLVNRPIRRSRSPRCARAASGHAAAAPPSKKTNSRRRIPDTRASPSQSVRRILSLPPTPWQVLGGRPELF